VSLISRRRPKSSCQRIKRWQSNVVLVHWLPDVEFILKYRRNPGAFPDFLANAFAICRKDAMPRTPHNRGTCAGSATAAHRTLPAPGAMQNAFDGRSIPRETPFVFICGARHAASFTLLYTGIVPEAEQPAVHAPIQLEATCGWSIRNTRNTPTRSDPAVVAAAASMAPAAFPVRLAATARRGEL
jgi:hypothetical protein